MFCIESECTSERHAGLIKCIICMWGGQIANMIKSSMEHRLFGSYGLGAVAFRCHSSGSSEKS